MREMWAWSMRVILVAAFGKGRGLILFLNLVLRWRRWWHRNEKVQGHWGVTYENFKDRSIDQQEFETAFADALAKRWGEDMRAQMRGEFDEI